MTALKTGAFDSTTLTFEVGSVEPGALELYYGQPVALPYQPRFSMLFDQVVTVSGEPAPPVRRRGLKGWWTYRKDVRRYRGEYAQWTAAGCPDVETLVRTYIPNARLQEAK